MGEDRIASLVIVIPGSGSELGTKDDDHHRAKGLLVGIKRWFQPL
jgi:hypothetical protein